MKAVYLFAAILTLLTVSAFDDDPCRSIQAALSPYKACYCFTAGMAATQESEDDQATNAWIGCTRQDMPQIHDALNAFQNDTYISKLWIWDSLLPIVPSSLFAHLRPRTLVCESSDLRKFREGAFDPLGERLLVLELKNNIINDISHIQFRSLIHLRRLDLSGNKLQRLTRQSFGPLASLHALSLYKNKIEKIGEGTFSGMPQLKRLNLGRNELTKIERGTFDGVTNVEHINLEYNKIISIGDGTFEHLKSLKTLNLGGNLLTSVSLRALPVLEKLFLNNNAFYSLNNVVLADLDSLQSLSLDKNHIQRVKNGHFKSVSAIKSLSMASNRIKRVELGGFDSLNELETLSLQNNVIKTLPEGIFIPLKHLQHLFLSQNRLTSVRERTFYGLSNLHVLGLAHNKISDFHLRSLSNLFSLERLYINDNALKTMENRTLQYVQSKMYALDISDNPWRCDCDLLWLSQWLNDHSDKILNLHATQCASMMRPVSLVAESLEKKCQNNGPTVTPINHSHSVWITVIGVLLGIVSVLILLAIALLYLQEGRLLVLPRATKTEKTINTYDIRRVPSDMVTLIPKTSTVIKKRVRFEDGS